MRGGSMRRGYTITSQTRGPRRGDKRQDAADGSCRREERLSNNQLMKGPREA
jgi:hypothetical protein